MSAQPEHDRTARLHFMQITPDIAQVLNEFWRKAEPSLPMIVDDFYRHVTAIPQLAALIGDKVAERRKTQVEHWQRLFSGRFDDDYFAKFR